MKESNLRFTNPIIEELSYEINRGYKSTQDNIQISNDFNVKIGMCENKNEAIVSLEIKVGRREEEKELPFSVSMVVSAMFAWDDTYNEKTIKSLLSINAPALLLGYARPIISSITNMSPYPSYNLPFYNFTE